jgi:hypothetical protein
MFVVYEKPNLKKIKIEELAYLNDPSEFINEIDNRVPDFKKVKKDIKKLHKMFLINTDEARKHVRKNYNFNERACILQAIGFTSTWSWDVKKSINISI